VARVGGELGKQSEDTHGGKGRVERGFPTAKEFRQIECADTQMTKHECTSDIVNRYMKAFSCARRNCT
jgi:hypothetical protein